MVLFMPVLSACTTGLVYTHTTRPLDLNLGGTEIGETRFTGEILHLQYKGLSTAWDSNAIGAIARKNEMETIYYADLEFLSVLGLWNRYTVHVYGK